MNQVNQGESSAGPSFQIAKRGRGRPRKDPSLKHARRAHIPPGFGRPNQQTPQRTDQTVQIDPMVGQAVTGVVEATFDAGYLLTVKIANSNTHFRGVVFKPGHFGPVTAANDIAPHVQMIRRNDVPFPAENKNWSHGQKLGMQTVPLKRKYAPRKAEPPPVHPVGEKGTVVPVVLQSVSLANGLQQASDNGDKDVHTVEPLSMLPPNPSKPVSQTFAAVQPQGSVHDNSISFSQGTSEFGLGDKSKSATSTDVDTSGSSQTSDMNIANVKEVLKSSAEDSRISFKQGIGNTSEHFPTETPTFTSTLFNFGTGRMTELLQAVQENMKESPLQIAEIPTPASKIEFHETMTTGNDSRSKESAHVTNPSHMP